MLVDTIAIWRGHFTIASAADRRQREFVGVDPPGLFGGEPDGRRDVEPTLQLHPPLARQRRGAEDQDRAVAEERADQGAARERQGLPDADFVGEKKPRPAVDSPMVKKQSDESPLPRHELLAAP